MERRKEQFINYPANFELPNEEGVTQNEYLAEHPCGQGRDRFPLTPGYLDPSKEYRGHQSVEEDLGAVVVDSELESAA